MPDTELTPIAWTSDDSVGVPWLDEQHRGLFDCINTLAASTHRRGIAEALEVLSRYFSSHFADEERYMEEQGYEGRHEHNVQHDHFVARVMGYVDRFARAEPLSKAELVSFLGEWIRGHIRREDRRYAPRGTTDPGGGITRSVAGIDWSAWVPTERAVLCFVLDAQRVLLINKLTGLGAGKVNAPGGRIEQGESPLQAAIRETREEVHVSPGQLREVGELFFQFTDGYRLHGTVFFARTFTGIPQASAEADPFWCPLDALPYDRMWEDDRYWLPLALMGNRVRGRFIFDGDVMLDKRVEAFDPDEQSG